MLCNQGKTVYKKLLLSVINRLFNVDRPKAHLMWFDLNNGLVQNPIFLLGPLVRSAWPILIARIVDNIQDCLKDSVILRTGIEIKFIRRPTSVLDNPQSTTFIYVELHSKIRFSAM